MKTNLLLLSLTLLTACQDPSKIQIAPFTPPDAEIKELIYEGSSGLVRIQVDGQENEPPSLPHQISVTIEKENSQEETFRVEKLHETLRPLLASRNEETLYFGCDTSEKETLIPEKIDAQKVVLCGKIRIPTDSFEMRASLLELRETELLAQPKTTDGNNPLKSKILVIYAANLALYGENTLTLKGFAKEDNQVERAPSLFLSLWKTFGEGHLNIKSHKSLTIDRF